MADIHHRLTIDASRERVHEMIATKTGIERWWTGQPLEGDEGVGGELGLYFGGTKPAAVMQVIEDTPGQIVWRCVDGPEDWRETRITYQLKTAADRETTLLFSHTGWREPTEFMGMCSTHWASYLIGLKAGLEGRDYTPYPQGEVNRWG